MILSLTYIKIKIDLGKVCLPEATLYFTMVQDYIDAGWVTNVIVDVKHSFFMISISLLLTCFFVYPFFSNKLTYDF